MFRLGIKQIIRSHFSEVYVHDCPYGESYIGEIIQYNFSLVMLGLFRQGQNGIKTLQKIKELKPDIPIIAWRSSEEEPYTTQALEAGATICIHEGMSSNMLIGTIEETLSEHNGTAFQINNQSNPELFSPSIECLSPKERIIFFSLANGTALKEIAAELSISAKTVSTYRTRIMDKLNLDSNASLVKFALLNSLIK